MSGLCLLCVLGYLVVICLRLGLCLPELCDETFHLIVLLVGLLPLLDLLCEDGDLLDDAVLLVLSKGHCLLHVFEILELFLQLFEGDLVLLLCLLSPVGGELLFECGDLLVPLVPELFCLSYLLVVGVALLPALSCLVHEIPDLTVELVPLGLPLFGLVVELVPELPVLLCILVDDAALLLHCCEALFGSDRCLFLCHLLGGLDCLRLLFLRILLLNILHEIFHKCSTH